MYPVIDFVLNPMYYENQALPPNAVGDSMPFTESFSTCLFTGRNTQFHYV